MSKGNKRKKNKNSASEHNKEKSMTKDEMSILFKKIIKATTVIFMLYSIFTLVVIGYLFVTGFADFNIEAIKTVDFWLRSVAFLIYLSAIVLFIWHTSLVRKHMHEYLNHDQLFTVYLVMAGLVVASFFPISDILKP